MFNRIRASATPRKMLALLTALTTALGPSVSPAFAASEHSDKTPIQHLVVIFNENISFDHYFGTYPVALNPTENHSSMPKPGTPTVNGLTNALLNFNPNLNPANGSGATNPFRLDRSQAVTADQDHDYTAEQMAFDMGAMDLFPKSMGTRTAALWWRHRRHDRFDHGLLRRQHRYRPVELRSEFRHERQLLRQHVRPFHAGVINLVSGQTNGVDQDAERNRRRS